MNNLSFFKILDQASKAEVIAFVDHNKTEFTLKILDQFVKTKVLYKKNETHLSLDKFGFYEFSNESAICSFQIGSEKYLFKSRLSSTTSDYVLEIPADIYQLQRRNHYRVLMPAGQIHTCEIQTTSEPQPIKIKAEVRNMSLGGCKLSIEGRLADLKQNDKAFISLKVDKYELQQVPFIVKRVRYLEKIDLSLMATSFDQPEIEALTELQSLLMFIDRIGRGKS